VGSISNVKLEYSTNAFATEDFTGLIAGSIDATGVPAGTYKFDWTVPDDPGINVKVRVSVPTDSTVYDLSNNPFSIKGTLTITSPNGAEEWVVGSSHNVIWTKFGNIANVKLMYSTDSGSTYPVGNTIVASTPCSDLHYSWTIPDSITNLARVKIMDAADNTVSDQSDADFIIKGSVMVTQPNGGQNWLVGESQNITWSKTGSIANVKLEYSTNGFADEAQKFLITNSTPAASGSYGWTVADAIGTNIKVRVTDSTNSSVTDVSDSSFTIKGALTLTAPNGGETWIVGESRNITWTRTGSITNVKLEYSTNGGTSYPNVIIASTPAGALSYGWTVADAMGSAIRVRVSDVSDSTVLDTSNADFTIKGSLTLTSPNGGEVWVVNDPHDITWAKTGSIANVKLECSTNGFADELQNTLITASTDATGAPPSSYKYSWTVADVISTTLKVRISNAADSSVNDLSNNFFKIKGGLHLTSPNGAENWAVGTGHSITWERTGTIINAKLDYSVNGGGFTNSIVGSTPAGGLSYTWTIPNNISNQIRVRISDAGDASAFDDSDADFAIMGAFTISSPNGSEVWVVNSQHDISWSTVGTVANVKLEYSTNGGTSYPNVIVASTGNNSPYNWTIPDAISNTVRVRISDANNANAFDTSNANFKIEGALTLTAPNGTEAWAIATHNNITWTRTGTIADVKLEYSTDSFLDELQNGTIIASTPGAALTYDWTIPDAPSSTVRVRISDVADSTVYDLSNADFRIIGSLTITSPNGTEQWVVNENRNVTWTKFGNIANVKLMYSTDGGSTYPVGKTIIASTSAALLSYTWTIPDDITSQGRVKISDVNDGTVTDQSDANFNIKGSVTLTAPNGGENLIVGGSQNITWTRNGSFANVKLEYSTNAFADESQLNTITASTPAAAGTYSWTVADAIGTNLKVRVSDAANTSVSDISNNPFTIKGALQLTVPNGSETWIVGESRNITWNRTGSIANVKLEYSINGGVAYPNLIIASTPAGAAYSWTVADAIGGDLRVRVSDASDGSVFDTSDASFIIKGALAVTSPNGNEVWVVNSGHNVTWTRTGSIANVKLEYSTNGFADELQTTVFANSTDATTGSYGWTTPDAIGNNVKVRVTNTLDDTVKDVSDSAFRITGALLLTAPNGGEKWAVGSSQSVVWQRTGNIANAKLELSTNGGTSYPINIVTSTPAGGLSYGWTIPDNVSIQARVKISDATDVNVFDTSDANFAILAGFTVTSPNGGEVWVVNDSHDITWTTNGTVSNVKLEYSTDGGSTYPNTIVASTPNNNSYAWTIPDIISITVKVRVSDLSNADAFDVSNGNFKVKGALHVNSPDNGTESWSVGYAYPITWTRTGSVQNINLYYSSNAGVDWSAAINGAPVDASLGTWSWTLPADTVLSTQARIKVTDTADATVTDMSNNNFEVKGGLRIDTPSAAGISLSVGNTYAITWTKFGSIPTAQIHYSENGGIVGGGSYPDDAQHLITTISASTQTFTWTVPDKIGTNLRIRIRQSDNYNVWDESDNAFEIKGKLTMVTPNGGEVWFVGDNQNIQWIPTGTFTSQVQLEYSTNAFADELQKVFIATVPAGADGSTQNYPWSVANAISGSLKIRVTDANNATVTAKSTNTFTIKGKLLLMQPNGGETWTVGTSQNITWQRTGTITQVSFKYSTDNGSTYPNSIATSIDGSLGTYPWTIPDAIGSNLRVKILDSNDATVEDNSNATFTIKGALTLTAPNGAEAWQIGTTKNITWTRAGSIGFVKLEFSLDGGATYPTTIIGSTDASTNLYSWLIPDNPCLTVKVRITDTSDPSVFDISNANFKIVGSLSLTTPNGAEMWGIAQDKIIRWTKTGSIANVKLQYSTNSGASYDYLITPSTPAGALEYTWNVSDTPSTTARVKISDASDVSVADESNADFKIQGRFTITSPDGSEVWIVGDSHDITWTPVGSVTNVKLEYSTNGGATYPSTIAASVGNTGSYSWSIPDAISAQVRVRVSDVNDYDAADASNGNFKIKGALLLTSPNGTENWIVGSTHNITWTRTGSVLLIKLEYSTDSGSSYPAGNTIIGSLDASLGTYNWTIPDAISSQVRVKVTDTSDSTVYDASNANFTIKGALTVSSPNGGENWIVASGHNITWTRTGSIASVKIDFSKNSGATYPFPVVASTDASTGSYAWNIPDELSTTVRVMVSDASDAAVFDTSNANFSIGGALTLNSPNGGQIWYVAEARTITWTRFGSIPTVKLEYSSDSGASYTNTIIASTDAASQTYGWSVPDAIGTHVRVKVTDTANFAVNDESDADFEIKGILTLTSPNGGETWFVGSSHAITWTPTGTIPFVKLEYSIDGGNTYPNPIIASTNGPAGTYTWTVADAIGTNLKVRVSNTADVSVNDASNNTFTVKGSITVTSPNGSEAWGVGSSHNITWSKTGTFATVKIDYSTDGGSTYPNPIIASIDASAGSHSWTIPDNISNQVKVKVTSNSDTSVNDVSDTNFKIVGILTLTAPNGTERWTVGTNNNITWTRSGSIANAKIQYSTDGGATFPNTIIASTPAGALSFTWSVDDTVSKTCRVRISDVTDITVYDDSNANFTIQAGFTITSPNGGEVYGVGSGTSITWGTVGTANTVVLEYTSNGTSWNIITASTLNTGSFNWTIPDAISTTCKVRVSDFNDANATDASNNNFKIRGDIVVTSPNGAEAWIAGSVHNVTWTMQGTLNKVDINYSTDGGATYTKSVATNVTATDLSYAWTVPNDLSQICRVKITDTADPLTFDNSNADFKIRGDFVLTSPNGAEVWNVSSVHSITWTRTGSIANAKLEYSTDGGNTYSNTIIASTDASALSYAWLIPDAIGTLVRVRISDASDPTVNDFSNANFKIRGSFTISSPNGSEEWEVSSSHNINWSYSGTIGNVKLEYSINSGVTYPSSIVASTPCSDRSYSWTIPDAISTQVRVKITNLGDLTVSDESDADFKVKGKLVVTAPNGGEVWPVASSQTIAWSRVGSVANVELEYSRNAGATFPEIIIASTGAAAGSYSWTVPDDIGSTMRVRVSDASDSSVFDVSDGNFKIRGDLSLTAPNGGEIWLINQNRNVTWTRFGSIANAKLEYSIDSGATYPYTIVGSVNAGLQTYGWSIPDSPTVQARVRISDAADPLVYDVSNANFTIRGGFVITSPNGAESWAVGSIQNITWSTFGSYTNVKLWYSTDDGATYPNIISGNYSNSGIFVWTLPDAISTQCKVKIADLIDNYATDESDAAFKIHGTLTVTAPNGGEQWGVGTSHNITWTRIGSVATAKLEYSTDGGTTYPNLINANVTASNLSYSWTVPDAIGSTLKVRISVADDSSVFDISDSTFTIRGTINVSAPNGGESWIVNSVHAVTWSSLGTITNVKLDYSIDGGTVFNNILVSTLNTGTYNWTVPDAISSQCRIKVSNAADPNTFDTSDNNFKIRGDLVITAPNGAETWAVATSHNITWTRTGSIANVRLEYSDNGGTTFVPIVASTPNAGSYPWTIPDAITTIALVRIFDAADLTVSDTSNAVFKIQGSFTVTSPNGGEAWGAATTHAITWTFGGSVGFINLSYSKDGGTSWTSIALSQPNTGTYDWFVPVEAVSTQCRVKVADAADAEAFDASNNNFRVRCSFILTSPNGGEQWRAGRTYNITWNKVGNPAAVKLEYAPDAFLDPLKTVTIDAGASSISPYSWTIPDYICNTTQVRISDAADSGANDKSDANFRITGDVIVTSPNGAEKWEYDTVHNITWTTAGTMANVKIEYSINGGANYTTIDAVANSGSYPWTVPNEISQNCLVRISDLSDATADDVSNAVFKIIARFTLTSPNGAEVWTVGDTHPITWTSLGTVANVKLSYSTNSGATYPNTIIASTPNDGSYDWSIPDAISTTVRVKVESAIDVDAFDVSNADFKIRGKFAVTSPNGGELWQINQNKSITWSTTGTIANVRIYYSIDSGATFPNTIVASVANINSYTWLVPDNRTPSARIRVENIADNSVFDDSDADFRIQGFVALTAPNGGEVWIAQDARNITWTWGGTMPKVKLSYSIDGGATYAYVIDAAADNGAGGGGSASYPWTVPNTLSQTAKVKIEDPNDATVADDSNAIFRIMGQIAVTSPVGAERWVTNETHAITWTNKGTIPNVKIIYSKDNFATSSNVVASVANSASFNWVIPDDRSTTVKVRVLDASDGTIYGTSPADFKIDYYNITWDVRDLLTNERLTNLSVSEKETSTQQVGWQAVSLTAPLVHATPYGYWTTVWSATGFGDKGQNFTANSDQSFTVYLETSAVHIWQSSAEFTYDAIGDNLKVTAWLQRDGSVVQGAAKIGIYIYDDTGTPISYNAVCDPQYYNYDSNADGEKDQCNPRPTLFSTTIDPSGYFYMTFPAPTGLQSGKVYAALVDIMNLSGAHFKTPTSFSITESKQLQNAAAAVQEMQSVTLPAFQTGVQNTINAGIDAQKQMITDIMVGSGGDPTSIMNSGGMVGIIQTSMTSFETATTTAITKLQSGAETAVAAGQQLQATAKKFSWQGNVAPDPALQGDTVSLQVQGQPSLMPLLSIYTWDNKTIVSDVMMTETRPGFYVYQFLADTRFTAGKAYTFMVTEQTTGGMISGSGMVESMGITTVAGLAAAAPEAERAAKKALEAIKAVESVLVSNENINVSLTLKNLKESVDALPATLNKEGPSAAIMNAINGISERLSKIMGAEGMDFSSLLDEKLGDNSSMKQLRNKTDSISAIVDLLLQIMESKLGGVDSPIISTSLQSGSVKFRIMAVNPSKTKVQKVQVRKYLPEEVKPKDVMDLGGLELEYDSEKGIYYVYKNDLDMQPNQVNVFEVEVEDIWMVPDSQVAEIKKHTDEILALFEKTPMYNTAKEITDTIYPVLAEIPKAQLDDTVSREQHIGIYRQNQQNIKSINEKLAELEKMLAPEKGKPTPNILERNKFKINLPSKSTTWLIILVVIIFLGIFAGIFFFVWQGQIKSSQDLIKDAAKSSFPGQKPDEKSNPPPK
jgi:hypothetical protein